jgi:hypothetical protein
MGNYVFKESLPTYGSFLELGDAGLLSNSCTILNDGNYNIDDRSSIYQICLDISEALTYQTCSDISEALSNDSLRVNKLLKNICL